MPAVRAFAVLVLAGFVGTWLTQAPTTNPRPPLHVVRVPATTSTVVTTTSTSTTTTMPTPRPARASRSATRPRPAIAAELDAATRQRVIDAICSHDWDCALMVRVGGCESGLRPWARNGTHVGIFQIAGATPGLIEEHVALAYSMWRNRGMQPWAASRSCWS